MRDILLTKGILGSGGKKGLLRLFHKRVRKGTQRTVGNPRGELVYWTYIN